jgi:UDP-glucose 4-epimerase
MIARPLDAAGMDQAPVNHTLGRSYDVPRIVLDITKATESFGWAPQIGLEQGIAETFEWVREQARPQQDG